MFKFKQAISRRGLLLLFALLLGMSLLSLQIDTPANLLVLRDPPTRTDAALVFGGDPGYERTEHAVRLYKKGLVSRLVLCGGEPGPGDHALSLMARAVELGVPRESLLLETKSTSTRETAQFASPLLRQHDINSLTLVTSPYHQRRAFLAMRRQLDGVVTLVNSPSDSRWTPHGWWRSWWSFRIVFSEYGKMFYYFLHGWI